jgi:preprotein translocase subunit SecG
MVGVLTVVFVIVCAVLMLAVLLQSGKGGGLSGTFGGTSEFVGGRSAANFLTRATTTLAATFMVLSIILSTMATRERRIEEQTEVQQRIGQTPATQMAPTESDSEPVTAPSDGQ